MATLSLADAAQNFIDNKGPYVDQSYQNISNLPVQNQWVGFLDGLSEMESGGAGEYGASNGTFVGMYQFGNSLLKQMHFYTGIGGQLLGVTNLAEYSNNPIAQDLSALIEFSGFNDGSGLNTYQSVYNQVQSIFTTSYGFTTDNFTQLLNHTFTINYIDATTNVLEYSQTVDFTPAGISAAAHLLGAAGTAEFMADVWNSCFNVAPDVQTTNTANLLITTSTLTYKGKPYTRSASYPDGNWISDGNNIPITTYINLLQNFNIDGLINSAGDLASFNNLAETLISYDSNLISDYLIGKKLNVTLTMSAEYKDTITSILQGLNLPADNLGAVDGKVILAGGDYSDTASSNADLIIGLGTETLIGGTGNDTFEYVPPASGTSTETINDSKGNGVGSIWVGSKQLPTNVIAFTSATTSTNGTTLVWSDQATGMNYSYSPTSIFGNTGMLTISGDSLQGGSIVIQDFDLSQAVNSTQGYLGIHLANQLTLGTGTTPLSGASSDQTTDVPQGGTLQQFVVSVAADLGIPQTLTLKLINGAADLYKLITGADTLTFAADGTVQITIPAGQSSVSLALIDTSGNNSADTATLNATLTDASGNAITSNNLAITFDNPNPNSGSGTATKTINGDLTPKQYTDNNQNIYYQTDALGNLVIDASLGAAPNYNDVLYGDGGNDIINTGNGINIVNGMGGNDTINGGTGNDIILGGDMHSGNYVPSYVTYTDAGINGDPTLLSYPDNGGNGNNLINGGGGQDVIIVGNGKNQIFADTQTDLGAALTQRDNATATKKKGDLIAVGDGDNTIVGSNGNDVIFTGTGNNTIVMGQGASTVIGGVDINSASLSWTEVNNIYNPVGGGSAPYTPPTPYSGSFFGGVPVGIGNDTIFGGSGNSTYWLSNGDNWLDAGGGNDYIQAGVGNNTIFGGSGDDTIFGGGGNNYIDLETGNDSVVLNGGNNTVIGDTGDNYIASGDNTSSWATSDASANNYIFGGSGQTIIFGSGGNDTLISGSESGGSSTMIVAGDGNEYVVGGNSNDTLYGGAGTDTIYAGDGNTSIQLSTNESEASTVYGGAGSDTIIGGAGNDYIVAGDGGTTSAVTAVQAGSGTSIIFGGAGVDQLIGGSGSDTLIAGSGTSTLLGGTGTEVMYSNIGNAMLIAGTGSDTLYGGAGTDVLQGNSSGDTLFVAGSGNETIIGGNGSNTYLFNSSFGNVELQNASPVDTFEFDTDISLSDLTFSATIGSDGSNALLIQSNNGGSLTIDGGLDGAIGTFTFLDPQNLSLGDMLASGNSISTTVTGANGNLMFSANGNEALIGGTGNDSIYGWGGNDTLIAGSGDQVLNSKSGNDLVIGGTGNDTLVSAAGNDTLVGGTGNTTFVVDSTTDVIQAQDTESNINTVKSSVSFVLPANVQNLTGTGSADINLTGNDLNNVITANAGNDVLIAGTGDATLVDGAGNDTLIGGAGNTTFVVSNANDVIQVQSTGTNINTVESSISYVLPANVQNLTGTGSADITLTGNDLNNVITANAGNDILIAGTGDATLVDGAGNDTLIGGTGNTTFVVNNANDVIQAQSTGANTVEASVSFGLSAGENVQNLTGTGSADITLTGNDQNNVITANAGNDMLIAGTGDATLVDGAGNDTLIGGTGNTTFMVNNANDVIQAQFIGTNTNSVESSISYALPANVQNLTGTGSADIALTGNNLGDVITANNGNDTLVGGMGNDTLVGGAGQDTFTFGVGMGQDTVIDASTQGAAIQLQGLVFSDLSATKQGNDLLLQVSGTNDSMLIQGYYANPQTSWSILDESGNSTTPQAILNAPPQSLVDSMESAFINQTKAAIVSGLSGYNLVGFNAGTVTYELPGVPTGGYSFSTNYTSTIISTYDTYLPKGLGVTSSNEIFPIQTYNPFNTKQPISYYDYTGQENQTVTPVLYYLTHQTQSSDITELGSSSTQVPAQVYNDFVSVGSTITTITNDSVVYADPVTSYQQTIGKSWFQSSSGSYNEISNYIDSQTFSYNISNNLGNILWVPSQDYPGQMVGYFVTPGSFTLNGVSVFDYQSFKTSVTSYSVITDIPSSPSSSGSVAVTAVQGQTNYDIQTINLGTSGQTVYANSQTVVNSNSGNDLIYDAGFAYGGTGNDTMIGGGTMMAGSGNDQMFAGSGSTTFLIAPTSVGADLIGGVGGGVTLDSLNAVYQAMGISDWQDSYQHANMYHYGSGWYSNDQSLLAAIYANSNGDWTGTIQDAILDGFVTYGPPPLPVLFSIVENSGLQPAPYYAANSVPVVTLPTSANDFQALSSIYALGILPSHTVTFEAGVSASQLQLSWGQTVSSLSGLATDPQLKYTTLNVSWGTNGQSIQILIPHADDPLGSGVSGFTFADGTSLTMAQMIAMAPPAPTFDPGVFSFQSGMGNQVVGSSYDSMKFGAGITAGNVQFFQQGADLLIKDGALGDSALIQNFAPNGMTGNQQIAQYQFADGSQGIYVTDGQGDFSMDAYDANGNLVGDFWQNSDGTYGNDTYNADGSSNGTEFNVDGSYSSYFRDGLGDYTTTNFDANGVKLNDSWTKVDGSHGSDAFNADGSSGGTAYNADGSYSSYSNDGHGDITTDYFDTNGNLQNYSVLISDGHGNGTFTNYGASGNVLNSTVTTNDGLGDTTTANFDANGNELSDSWTKADGSYGNDTFNADGSRTGISHNALGDTTTTYYDPNGNKLSDSWVNVDGSSGGDTFNSDGSSSGYAYYADGSTSTHTNDGQGDVTTYYFDSDGNETSSTVSTNDGLGDTSVTYNDARGAEISDSWTQADGTYGSDTYNPDGSYSSIVYDGVGDSTTTNYSAVGIVLNDSWTKADGSYGTDIFNADGSSSGTTYNADGSYSSFISDGVGDVTTQYFDASGTLQSYSTLIGDGQGNGTLTNFNANGVELGYSVLTNDGSGDTATTNYDANGNLLNDLYRYGDGSTHSDAYAYDANGNQTDTWQNSDGSHGVDINNVDGSRSGTDYNPDGSYYTYTLDASGNNYVELDYAENGNLTGSYTWSSDGLGNSAGADFDANGKKIDDNWTKADGSYGSDTFNADGSSSGTAYNTDGSYSNYTNDGLGDTTTTSYDANGNELGYSIAVSDGHGDVTTQYFDAGGTLLSYSILINDGSGDTTTTNFNTNGDKLSDSWTNANGAYGNDTFNTDGSSSGISYNADDSYSSYTNNGLDTTTTNYDANGNELGYSIAVSDGHGDVTTQYFDASGNLISYSVLIGDGQGNGTLTNYDASGNVLGSIVSTNDGVGDTSTTNYDAGGNKLNDSWTKANGSYGNDTFNTDGSSNGNAYNADGSYSNYTNELQPYGYAYTFNYDANGNLISETADYQDGSYSSESYAYNANNNLISDTWQLSNGNYGSDTYNADGSYSNYVNELQTSGYAATYNYDANGNLLSESNQFSDGSSNSYIYDANGKLLSDSYQSSDGSYGSDTYTYDANGNQTDTWQYSDGSHGIDINNVDGSGSGTDYNTDGSNDTYTYDGQGTYSQLDYSANGILTGDNWNKPDGSYGSDTFNADGSSSGTAYNADGSYSNYTNDGQGDVTTDYFDASGTELNDSWVKANGMHGTDTFNADGSSSGTAYNADGSYSSYTNDGLGHLTTTNYDASGNPINNPTNRAPLVGTALADQTGTQDQVFNFSVPTTAFSDPDSGDILTLGATLVNGDPLPSWLTFNAATQTFSGTPGNADVGNLNLKVTATDIGGLSASSNFALNVINVNDPPVANSDTGAATEGSAAVTLSAATLLANDTDPDTIYGDTLSIVGVSQAASGAVVSLVNGDVQYNIGNLYQSLGAGQTATDTFNYTIADTAGATSTATVTMTITGTNDAPVVANAISTQNTAQGQAFSFAVPNGTFSDVDQGDTLTLSAKLANGNALPSWVSFNAATQTFSGTPGNGDVGSMGIVVTATDTGGLTASNTYTLNVANVNDAPIAAMALAAQSATQGQTFTYTIPANSFTDVDAIYGDTLTYSATQANGNALPSWVSFNTATQTFSGTPGNGDVANLSIMVTATDTGGLSANSNFTLAVNAPVINGTSGNDNLTGTIYDDTMYGLAGNDTLTGGAGNDLLDGGAGADTMIGGTGNDTYVVDNTGDVVTENANEGIDTVQSSITYTLGTNVENLTLTGTSAINGTGNSLNNVLIGNSANNVLNGGTGADTMTGGLGNDTYYVDNAGDVVVENAGEGTDTVITALGNYTLGANVENLTLTGVNGANAIGNALNNVMTVTSEYSYSQSTLDGGVGADTMIGGAGNDTFYVDNVGDVVTEAANGGTDTVISSISYTLGANVENLTLTGAGLTGTGNALNNSYTISDASDVIVEAANGGTDTVNSSVSYTLGANIENLTLTGTAAINGTGNSLDNIFIGNSAANTLTGGLGNDTYYVGTGDVVVENAGEGTDTVITALTSYTLGANVENLTLTGVNGANAIGNALNNVMTVTSEYSYSQSTLDGGVGADTMIGGAGNDTFYVDNVGDQVVENTNGGTDTVISSISYTLAANVENLTLSGTTAINGTGNALNNVLTGNSGSNTLDGGTGADTMIGGAGDDTYIVDNTGDIVTEAASAGTDTVLSSISYTLGANVENLTLTGTTAINGTGNTLDNVLYGNTAANTLTGGTGNDLVNGGAGDDIITGDAGNDVLEGADGNDTLSDSAGNNLFNGGAGADILTGNTGNELFIGGTGNDTITTGTGVDIIAFNTGDGQDTVVASTGSDNTISLGGGINYANLAMSKSGNDLILSTGGSDQITLQNWYSSGTTNHSIANLQLVLDAGTYNASSSDPLLNQQVQDFDFAALAQAFDNALAATPTLTSWNLTNALLNAHLSGSNTAALGGDLAYQYNLNGTLAGIGLASAQTVMNDASFGVSAQQLHPLASLQTGTARLS